MNREKEIRVAQINEAKRERQDWEDKSKALELKIK